MIILCSIVDTCQVTAQWPEDTQLHIRLLVESASAWGVTAYTDCSSLACLWRLSLHGSKQSRQQLQIAAVASFPLGSVSVIVVGIQM